MALTRALGTRSSTRLGTHGRCQKQRRAPPGTAKSREVARVQRGTAGRTRQNTHRAINPPAAGPRTSSGLCEARRGLFRGVKGYLLAGPGLWQQGLAGLPQDTGAEQPSRPAPGSEFLRFRWAGREASKADFPERGHGSFTCRGPAAAGPGALGGCLCSGQNPANKGSERHGQHNAGGSGAGAGGRGGSPANAQPRARSREGGSGVRPGSLCTPRPKHTEPRGC